MVKEEGLRFLAALVKFPGESHHHNNVTHSEADAHRVWKAGGRRQVGRYAAANDLEDACLYEEVCGGQ